MSQTLNINHQKLSIQDIKHVQKLAIKAYNKGTPKDGHGIVLFTRLEDLSWFYYAWKDSLRDPQSEEPGSLALDQYGNIWIAEGGNNYDGAKQWSLLHKQSVHVAVNPIANTYSEHFCPQEAAIALAAYPVGDRPYVLQVQATGESLDRESIRVLSSVSMQQKPGEEPNYTITLHLDNSENKRFAEAYLKAALKL